MNSQDGPSDDSKLASQAPLEAPIAEDPSHDAPMDIAQPDEPRGMTRQDWRRIGVGALVFALLLVMYLIVRHGRNRTAPTASSAAPSAAAAPPDLLTLSVRFYQEKRYVEAIAAAKTIVAQNPNSAEAYNNLGVSYAGLQQWDEAIKNLQEAIRLRPDFQLARNSLAWILQEKQKAASSPPAAQVSPGAEQYLYFSLQLYQIRNFRNASQQRKRRSSCSRNSRRRIQHRCVQCQAWRTGTERSRRQTRDCV